MRRKHYGLVATEGHHMIAVDREGQRVILSINGIRYPFDDLDEVESLARYLKRAFSDAEDFDPAEED